MVTIFLKSSHLKIRVLLLSYWSLLQLGIGFFVDLCQIMVFNATFNNISVISWQSLLLVKETEVPGENHRSVQLYHIMLPFMNRVRIHNFSGDRH